MDVRAVVGGDWGGNWGYDILDEIYPSCSGTYYVHCWDTTVGSFIPISIEHIIDPEPRSSFIFKHLEEYKSKMIRTKKLDRICQ